MSENPVAERFAANLAHYKGERGLSLTDISDRAAIHRTHVGLILRGERLVRIDTIVKLAAALDVKPSALLEGVSWEPPRGSSPKGRFR